MNLRSGLPLLLSMFFFAACHKDSNPPTPVTPPADTTKPPPTLGSLNINLVYPSGYGGNYSYEMIISEPGGKVLLDTVAFYGTSVKATLRTNASLVDLTLVDTPGTRGITIFKSVNPATWVNTFPSVTPLPRYYNSRPNTTSASVHFTNFPATGTTGSDIFQTFFFNNGPSASQTGLGFSQATNAMDIGYLRYPGVYNYIAVPQLGLYKLYIPTRDKDTVDLTHMDTLVQVTYPRVTPFTTSYFGTTFLGITDTTNRLLDINFMDRYNEHPLANVDLQYPRLALQAYEIYYTGSTPTNDGVGFYCFGKTVPSTWTFIDPSQFSVNSKSIDNLSIKYNSSITTYCHTYWHTIDNATTLSLFSSPDSTTINPLKLLTGLNAKFLSGVPFSTITCAGLELAKFPGQAYSDYFTYFCDPAKIATHQISSYTYFNRSF